MAQTIKWPIERTVTGGCARTETPAEATGQCIALSMIPGRSASPWENKDGIGMPGGVYEVSSGSLTPAERDFVESRFDDLSGQRRARLNGEPSVSPDGGTRRIALDYTDLETGAGGSI